MATEISRDHDNNNSEQDLMKSKQKLYITNSHATTTHKETREDKISHCDKSNVIHSVLCIHFNGKSIYFPVRN